jgi:hypothetical protein
MNPHNFFAELKRRNVCKVAAIVPAREFGEAAFRK